MGRRARCEALRTIIEATANGIYAEPGGDLDLPLGEALTRQASGQLRIIATYDQVDDEATPPAPRGAAATVADGPPAHRMLTKAERRAHARQRR